MEQKQILKLPSIAVLGAGSMGGAILLGLLGPHVEREQKIRATVRTEGVSAERFRHHDDVEVLTLENDVDANKRAAEGAEVIVLAVKPQYIPEVAKQIADVVNPGSVVVSVASGVTLQTLEAIFPDSVGCTRAMPNTPAIVGRAVSGISAGASCTQQQLEMVCSVFQTVGQILVVDEVKLDALSAISGSGPAYMFYVIESFKQAALYHGFTPAEAETLVMETFIGSALLLDVTKERPVVLRRKVTSPNGTTQKAVEVMQEANLSSMFICATEAAVSRAQELAEESSLKHVDV